jgi:hypothetical protein
VNHIDIGSFFFYFSLSYSRNTPKQVVLHQKEHGINFPCVAADAKLVMPLGLLCKAPELEDFM